MSTAKKSVDEKLSTSKKVVDEKVQATKKSVDEKMSMSKKSKGKRRGGVKNRDDSDVEEDAGVTQTSCAVCKKDFLSKNKLFAHLKSSGHAVPLSNKK